MVVIRSQFLIFAILAIGSLYTGIWGLSPEKSVGIFQEYGYWTLFVTFLWFISCLFRILRSRLTAESTRQIVRRHKWAVFPIIVATVLFCQTEEAGFKIFDDEIALLATSRQMHYEREIAVPERAHTFLGVFDIFAEHVDKRPAFYPFLVSMLHDLLGYNPDNPLLLNQLLTPLFFVLIYAAGFLIGRSSGGLIAILLTVSIPAIAQSSNSGGFEFLNLTLILTSLFFSFDYFRKPEPLRLSALCLSGVLLAQTRYESGLFLGGIGCIAIAGWIRTGRAFTSPAFLLSPLLLLPLLLNLQVFKLDPSFWELGKTASISRPFGIEFVLPNLVHAKAYFLDLTVNQPNNPLVFILGLICAIILPFQVYRAKQKNTSHSIASFVQAVFLPFFFILFVVVISYAHGQLNDPIAQRLALPFYIPLLLSLLTLFHSSEISPNTRRFLTLLFVLSLAFYSLPVMARRVYDERYIPAKEVAWCRRFVDENSERDYLMIANASFLWISHNVDSISMQRANQRKRNLHLQMRLQRKKEILVFQTMDYDPATGIESPRDPVPLSSDFILRPLRSRFFTLYDFVRISKVVSVKLHEEAPIPLPDGHTDPNVSAQQMIHFWRKALP